MYETIVFIAVTHILLDMCIFHYKLIDTFCTILPQGYFFFLLEQTHVFDTGDEAVMKIHKKNKFDIPEIGVHFLL